MKSLFASLAAALLVAASATAFGAPGWTDNYEKAMAQAKAENKKVLLDFTGSDWCGWCMKLDKETFSQPKFKDYAKQNLILVTVDFPQGKKLLKKVQDQNEKLKNEYQVNGFPTLVLLDADGKKLTQIGGYVEGGPDALIAKLEQK
jgi:protein disulfide-isomerase